MKDFKSYVEAVERTYQYRLKTVVPLDDEALDRIERAAMKYDPIEFGEVKKTMLQAHPLDFAEVQNAEVFILDMTLRLPASAYVLQQDFRNAMGIPEAFIRVRTVNDPLELETERLNAVAEMDAEAAENGLTPAAKLSIDPAYPEAADINPEDYYGDKYNARFTDYLYKVAQEREPMEVDAPAPLFKWLDMPDAGSQGKKIFPDNFNDDVEGAPTSAADRRSGKKVAVGKKNTDHSRHGNLDDDGVVVKRAYQNRERTIKVLSRTTKALRKEGK